MSRLGARQLDLLTHVEQILTKNGTGQLAGRCFWRHDPDTTVDKRAVQALLDRGLIRARPVPGDVIWEFTLTDAGRRALPATSN